FSDTATATLVASVNNGHTPVTGISKNISAAGWLVGMKISGTGLANPNSTIYSIDSTTSPTAAAGQGGGNHSNVTLTVTSASASLLTSSPGGTTDFHYMPSYVSSSTYSRPGVGGYTSTSINGSAGAVVLIW
ncbi:MAG: hypothetical protein K1X51_12185, partial [Rhodospirillaceae bacterium]|nr:hypothetical protein [Rhodospirillaceae bacterium]